MLQSNKFYDVHEYLVVQSNSVKWEAKETIFNFVLFRVPVHVVGVASMGKVKAKSGKVKTDSVN